MHCSKFGRLCGAFNSHVDFAPKRLEVDCFCQSTDTRLVGHGGAVRITA
jgi:hypothetical protein